MKLPATRSFQWIIIALVVVGIIFLALSGYLTTGLKIASSPLIAVQSWLSTRYMTIYEFFTIPRDSATLRQRNTELENEIALLRSQNIQYQQQVQEAEVCNALLDFGRAHPENRYIAAVVLGRDPNPFLRYFYIDRGSDIGIRHGMPVVTQQGLVGRIDAVTATASRVQLITDPAAVVNVLLQPSQAYAQMVGSQTGDINLEMIPQDAVISPGDLVLTSGLGGNYPPNIVIGEVLTVRKLQTGLFQSASIQPAVDFRNLQAVLVIVDFNPVDISPVIPTESP
jgi:rod shape-determining protein MreC